jgi:hypothetical protein
MVFNEVVDKKNKYKNRLAIWFEYNLYFSVRNSESGKQKLTIDEVFLEKGDIKPDAAYTEKGGILRTPFFLKVMKL